MWNERKTKKKEMSEAMEKLKESGEENKIKLAKSLARYYGIFHNIGDITTNPNFPFKKDKYGLHYIHIYLENFVDSSKRIIAAVIKALADDKFLDPFHRNLLFSHLFTPEQVIEIGRKEKAKRERRFELYGKLERSCNGKK